MNILIENEAIESHESLYNVFRNGMFIIKYKFVRKSNHIKEVKLYKVWADNGDILSIQYAGTGALKSDYTRFEKFSYFYIIL